MTTWVDNPRGGRERGPRGLARAWVEILLRPRRFFRNGVAPGDQAPGLVFAVAVAVVYVGSRFLFVPASRPTLFADETASVLVGLLVAALLVAPVALHLVAALEVLVLLATVRERAGVSETVQVIAYASAPMALAGVGVHPALAGVPGLAAAVAGWQLLCAAYGTALFVVGIHVVHDVSLLRAAVAAALPAVIVFGYFFGGIAALEQLTGAELVRSTRQSGAEEASALAGAAGAKTSEIETQLPSGR